MRTSRISRLFSILTIGWILGTTSPTSAQSAFHWRSFTAATGLTNSAISAVTIGPRDTVWLRHDQSQSISRFDGYGFEFYPYPSLAPSRIYEGLSGQLWAVDKQAILEFSGSQWIRHPRPEIQQEFRSNMRRITQPISMIPLRINNVLILLSDRLIRFDARRNEVATIQPAQALNIGSLHSLIERANQTLLITGERGVATANETARTLTKQTTWNTLPAPAQLRDLQRPTENRDGSVSVIAIGPNQTRYIASVLGTTWTMEPIDQLKLRFAWQASEAGYWGQSYNAIYRIGQDQAAPVSQNEVSAGLLLDVAVSSPDTFYIASSEGLYRHTPPCWQRPHALPDIDSSIYGALQDDRQGLWFLNSDALLHYSQGQWQRHPWPEDSELVFRPSDSLHQLDPQRLLIVNGERQFTFQIDTGKLTPFQLANGSQLQSVVGTSQEGEPIILWRREPNDESPVQLGLLRGQVPVTHPSYSSPWTEPTPVNFVVETRSSELWFGDQEGIGLIAPTGIERFGFDEGLPSDRAAGLVELSNGLIWAAIGTGIFEFDGENWRAQYFAPDRVNALMQASDKSIWTASNSGIHRYHYDSWVTINAQDGLAGNTVYTIIENDEGQIWAGTARGLNRYHPEADSDSPRSNIRILANTPAPSGGNAKYAVFEARDKWDFTPKERLLFSYRLDQRPWTPYGEKNDLLLQDLTAGMHRLEVRAMDRNWNEEEIAADYRFMWLIPWYDDPRLIVITGIGIGVILLLSGLAINRHLRLIRSYAEVERIVAVRTTELEAANRELLHNQKMRALGTLSAGIAHDFNGILSIIRGSTQIIESNLDNPAKVKTRLQRIRLVTDQGAGVIRGMLGLARSGEQHLRTVDINEAIATTIQVLGDRLPETLRVEFTPSPTLPSVRLVVDLLQQALVNLISNASDAMEGRGMVHVRTDLVNILPKNLALQPAPATEFNTIVVEDSGHGIPTEMLPRIFEPFFTSKAFSSKRGTGLGLSMVYEMARALKAGLGVHSIAGKGSTFTIYLPINPPQPADKRHPAAGETLT